MKAVILAAGLGNRLRPRTENLPKALIEIEGKPILEYSLMALEKSGLREVVIVVGFLGDLIRERFGRDYKGLKISYITNNDYSQTGSMYSFSQVKDLIKEDVLLLESDLLYDPRVIEAILESSRKNCMLVAKKSGSGDEVHICVGQDFRIMKLGKKLTEKDDAIGEMVGISKFSKGFLASVFDRAQKDYEKGDMNYHYEECVLAQSLLGEPVHAFWHSDLIWTEVDNEDDLKRARQQVYQGIKTYIE